MTSMIPDQLAAHLCPQLGYTFRLQGKPSSIQFKMLNINVSRCNSTLDFTCVNDTVYAGLEATVGRFVMAVPYINRNINPGSDNYN